MAGFATADDGFRQEPFQLHNPFDEDDVLQAILKRHLPGDVYREVAPKLSRLGDRMLTDVQKMAQDAELNQPRLEQYDAFGHRVDRLIIAKGWTDMHDVAAEEGLVATAYERAYGEHSRVVQMAMMYIFGPYSSTYSCPLAMTDGAARLIELSNDAYLKREVYPHLVTRDPKLFWTSGQWMTERPGGSDISRTETAAVQQADGTWKVSGFKWFSSATDADITLLLARPRDATGNSPEGSKGLSLYFARVRKDDGKLNGVRIHRLKNKMGTKALPTAELELQNMAARLVGEPGRGVATIATILNVTRTYAGVSSAAGMRRMVAMARDYATRRQAFGELLSRKPLHVTTLATMELDTRACIHLSFEVVRLLGRSEVNKTTRDEELLLRLLTPLVKLFTTKMAVVTITETMESMGGLGYIEDSNIPRALRDGIVNCIWEGTTNVLSLDVLRVLAGADALTVFGKRVNELVAKGPQELADPIRQSLHVINTHIQALLQDGRNAVEAGARELAYALARTMCAALLVDHAQYSQAADDNVTAERWVKKHMLGGPTLGLQAHTDRDNLNAYRSGGRGRDERAAGATTDYLLVYGQARL